MTDKQILFIVNSFPPPLNGGNMRVYKFIKYLKRSGWNIYVVCNCDTLFLEQIDDKILSSDLQGVNFFPIQSIGKKSAMNQYKNYETNIEVTKKKNYIKLIYDYLKVWAVPDIFRYTWNRRAYKQSCDLIDEFNIKNVITSSPPHSTQLIGEKLKDRYKSEINWIVDFRDLWSNSHIYELKIGKNKFYNKYLESQILKKSDHIIFVSNEIEDLISVTFNKINIKNKSSVITNGYDDEDFREINNNLNVNNSVIEFSYIGSILGPQVNLKIFKGIQQFFDNYKSNNIIFNFIGIFDNKILNDKSLNAYPNIKFSKSVPHQQALEAMTQSDYLILILTNDFEGKIAHSGKFFEYLKVGKPILAIVPKGAVSKTIDELGIGIVVNPDDSKAIADAIEKFVLDIQTWRLKKVSEDKIKQFSREVLSQQLENILINEIQKVK